MPESARFARAPSAPQRAMVKLGLARDIDLALHLPLRYEDETRVSPIADVRDGETAQVQGTVREAKVEFRPRRQLVVRIADASDELVLRFLHFYPSHQKTFAPGRLVRVRGEVRGGFLGREMVHPAFRAVEADTPLPSALTPVYPTTAQLPQAYLRKAIAAALTRAPLAELLPAGVVPAGLPTLKDALQLLHHPPPNLAQAQLEDRSHPAWQRLKYEELLAQQLAQGQALRERARLRAPALPTSAGGLHAKLLATLPFALTPAQARVCAEIDADLARAQPMHRLLQGDVGAGKTVVAALAACRAIDAGWQCALMAPTEILAEQHFRKLVHWLEPLGLTIAWLAGSRKGKGRAKMVAQVASGEAQLVVGTHAVIQHDVLFARLGLAVVDEQHRFGVAQRLALRDKLVDPIEPSPARGREREGPDVMFSEGDEVRAELEPHLLMMSATPIPRTLAMTYYADLDVSTIDALPPGRTPVVTKLFAESRRDDVVARIRDEVARGRQVYWVCPLVEASQGNAGPPQGPLTPSGDGLGRARPRGRTDALDLQNAVETHARLAQALPGRAVGLIHGRLSGADKAAAMAAFASGAVSVLVATTVIEVGVDVPNASLMVIEHAERFGLAQLHQLRGRVGRGPVASACVLLYATPLSVTARARLKAMLETGDGFEIARRDLEIRGPGEFMGARQSGAALLRFADLNEDAALLQRARTEAARLLVRDAEVARAQIERWLGSRAEFLSA